MTPERKAQYDALLQEEHRNYPRFKPDMKHKGYIDLKNRQIAHAKSIAADRLQEIRVLQAEIEKLRAKP